MRLGVKRLKLIFTVLVYAFILGLFGLGQRHICSDLLTSHAIPAADSLLWWYSRPYGFRGIIAIVLITLLIFITLAIYLIAAHVFKWLEFTFLTYGTKPAEKLAAQGFVRWAELYYIYYIDTFSHLHNTEKIKKQGVFDFIKATMDLAHLYCEAGKFFEAESLYRIGLKSMKEVLGVSHPDLIPPLEGYAGVLQLLGQNEAASKARAQACQISSG